MLVFSLAVAPLSVSHDSTRAVNLLYCRSPRVLPTHLFLDHAICYALSTTSIEAPNVTPIREFYCCLQLRLLTHVRLGASLKDDKFNLLVWLLLSLLSLFSYSKAINFSLACN